MANACIGNTGPSGDTSEQEVPCRDDDENNAGTSPPYTPTPTQPSPPPSRPSAPGGERPSTPPDEPSSPPEEPKEKSPRIKCLEENQIASANHAECEAIAASKHTDEMKNICAGGGTIQFGLSAEAGYLIVTGGAFASISIDQYSICKDKRDSKRETMYKSCNVILQRDTKVCPGD
ncbi:hypothetical protein [Agaribacter flavus]|uniref:Uncharacterized protein n=1 Tax=Agaribacter flavus TaxID=1902781 RepID=A0ABV7FPI7_9ALTE